MFHPIKNALIASSFMAASLSAANASQFEFRYQAHELETAAGVEALYDRIKTDARTSCVRVGVRPLYVRLMERDCVVDLVDEYVAHIDSRKLTALYAADSEIGDLASY